MIALTGRILRLDPVIALPIAVGVADPAAALCLKAVGALRGKAVDFTAD
ncbi:hypothetical protein [Mycobacterium sp. 1245499.0]|nr:hypothetical protein [Mycobacterium sp. 1245499.0]